MFPRYFESKAQQPKMHREYDAFITFDVSLHEKAAKFCAYLAEAIEVSCFLDKPNILMKTEKYKKLMKVMLRCKLLLCCVNKEYLCLPRSKDVLTIAYTSSIPIVVLFFEDMKLKELAPILFATDTAPKVNVFEHFDAKKVYSDELLPELIIPMQASLDRKLSIKALNDRRPALFSPDEEELAELREEMHRMEGERDKQGSVEDASVFDSGPNNMFINPAKLRFQLMKSNPLYETIYGYNRMVFLEARKRFLITSSYNKSIISIDNAGNWLEKRNPNSLLQLPWAICVNRRDEIYVGDNACKCVFAFDKYFTFLRTFAKNILNGFGDMTVDADTDELFVVSLYDSALCVLDAEKDVLMKRVFMSMPKFIKLTSTHAVVLTVDDSLFFMNKTTLEFNFKIDIENSRYLSALSTFDYYNAIVVTAYDIGTNNRKSRNVYLCVVKLLDDKSNISAHRLRKLNLKVDQVNDMVIFTDSIFCVDDTHVNIFKYENLVKLLNYDHDIH